MFYLGSASTEKAGLNCSVSSTIYVLSGVDSTAGMELWYGVNFVSTDHATSTYVYSAEQKNRSQII